MLNACANKTVWLAAIMAIFLSREGFAHGTQIWFALPKENTEIRTEVTFVVETPRDVEHKYVNIKIVKAGTEKPVWEGLVEKTDNTFSTRIDVQAWEAGNYQAEALLLGEIFPHPAYRLFVVREAKKAVK